MATENRGVMIYLPVDVEEYITNFCTEYNITRKDKEGNILPSLGTGVVTYLKSKISGESPDNILTKPSKLPSNGLSKDEVLDLIREYNTSESLSNGLTKSEVLDLIVSDRLSNLPLIIEATTPKPARKLPEAIDLNSATTASFTDFYAAVGLEVPTGRLKADAQPAIDKAIELGFEGWRYDGKRKNLERKVS